MFGKLFGKPAEKPKEAPKVDPMQEINKLNDTLNTLEKRHKVLSLKKDECRDEALKAKKAGDQRTALKWMQRMKTIDKDLAKIDGQQLVLEQQKVMLEGSVSDAGVFQAMKSGKDAIKNLQKEANIDDIADVKADLEEMMAEHSEAQEMWAGYANEGKDELLDELEELEAESAQKELEAMDLAPSQPIKQKPKPAQKYVEEQKEEEDEDELELKKLMMV